MRHRRRTLPTTSQSPSKRKRRLRRNRPQRALCGKAVHLRAARAPVVRTDRPNRSWQWPTTGRPLPPPICRQKARNPISCLSWATMWVGLTSALITRASCRARRRTSIGSLGKGCASPITTRKQAARPAAPILSPARFRSAPVSPPWGKPVPTWAFRPRPARWQRRSSARLLHGAVRQEPSRRP